MNNLEKLNQAFVDAFAIDKKYLKDLVYKGVSNWDSVGQMVWNKIWWYYGYKFL